MSNPFIRCALTINPSQATTNAPQLYLIKGWTERGYSLAGKQTCKTCYECESHPPSAGMSQSRLKIKIRILTRGHSHSDPCFYKSDPMLSHYASPPQRPLYYITGLWDYSSSVALYACDLWPYPPVWWRGRVSWNQAEGWIYHRIPSLALAQVLQSMPASFVPSPRQWRGGHHHHHHSGEVNNRPLW